MAYIFLGGSQRTGTSIAQQTLCQLPSANPYLYEASFLRQLVSCYSEPRNNFNRNHASYFNGVSGLRSFCGGVVHAFLESVKAQLGNVEHLILKEPHLTLFFPYLYELVPEARFLLMVRDPRDAIASMVSVGEKQKAMGQKYLFANRDIPAMCSHFLSFYEPSFGIEDEAFRKQLAVVHYEELVSDPQQTMVDIANFTGLPFDQIDTTATPDEGHVTNEHISTDDGYSAWTTEVSGEKLSKCRIGNYVNVLSEEEAIQVEECCSDFFGWFGYVKSSQACLLS